MEIGDGKLLDPELARPELDGTPATRGRTLVEKLL
jgi:hypothetical protein